MAKKTTKPAMKEINKRPEMGKMPNKAEIAMMAKMPVSMPLKSTTKKSAPKKGGKK